MDSNTISPKNEISQRFPEELSQARTLYAGLGFDTIPIKPGEKAPPLIKGWQTKHPADMCLGISEPVNIAIRCGERQNLAVIDCDDAESPGVIDQTVDFLCLLRLNPFLQFLKRTEIDFEKFPQIIVLRKNLQLKRSVFCREIIYSIMLLDMKQEGGKGGS